MTDTPIIGVLSQENYLLRKAYPEAHSFIIASYVKFLEIAGARVIPIWIGQNEDYYKRIVSYTNGILFPGGGTFFEEPKGYGEAALHIYKIVNKLNQQNIHYPILGICLGMQALIFAENQGTDLRTKCMAKTVSLPLNIRNDGLDSKFFSCFPTNLMHNLRVKSVIYHNHMYCLLEKVLKEKGITKNWRILSTNQDLNGLEFISTIEHNIHPFYGVQYHPEKNLFEFKDSKVSHSLDAIDFSQYLANFFVRECRKNNHRFPNRKLELKSLICNYKAETSFHKSSYEQVYLFSANDYENNLL